MIHDAAKRASSSRTTTTPFRHQVEQVSAQRLAIVSLVECRNKQYQKLHIKLCVHFVYDFGIQRALMQTIFNSILFLFHLLVGCVAVDAIALLLNALIAARRLRAMHTKSK